MNRNECQEQIEWATRAHAAILADALVNGRKIFADQKNARAYDVVTKAIVDLRRSSGASPEVLCGALAEAAWTCHDDETRRGYEDEARRIAAKEGSSGVRRTVFAATR